MKQRTILLVIIPCVVVAAAALVAGALVAGHVPTGADIEALTNVGDSAEIGKTIRSFEDYISLCLLVASVAVIVAGCVILNHVSTLPRVAKWREKVFGCPSPAGAERVFVIAALVIAVVISGGMLCSASSRNRLPRGDEISYLEAANHAQEEYGMAGFAAALYTGKWSEYEIHPLYVWTLMPFASRGQDFYAKARLLSTILAGVSLVVVFFVSRRFFGTAAAVVVLLMLGLNRSFLTLSGSVVSEVLLMPLVVLAVYFTVRGFDREGLFAVAGTFAGLAYMTNVTGLFLPITFLVTALFTWGLKTFRKKHFYFYFAAFVIVSSPLLTRNTVRQHNPISNYAFSLFWIDGPGEALTMKFVDGKTGGAAKFFRQRGPVGVSVEFLEHAELFRDTASRAVSPWARTYYKIRKNPRLLPIRLWVGRTVLLLAVVILLFDTNVPRRTFVVALALVVFIPMAWYARISTSPRSVMPFVPLILGYFATGLVMLVPRWQYRAAFLTGACLLGIWSFYARFGIVPPGHSAKPPADALILAQWLDKNLSANDVYLLGPDNSLRFGWYHKTPGCALQVPITRDVPSLVAASVNLGAKYVVISRRLYRSRPLQFGTWIRFKRKKVVLGGDAEGWKPVFKDPLPPVDYVVFEVEKADVPKPGQ